MWWACSRDIKFLHERICIKEQLTHMDFDEERRYLWNGVREIIKDEGFE